jgi:hypothetical protein
MLRLTLVTAVLVSLFPGTASAGLVAVLEAELVSSNGETSWGMAVAVRGETAVIGEKAAVFSRAGGSWHWVQQLEDPGLYGNFGASVAISDDTIVAGNTFGDGAAHAYALRDGRWELLQRLAFPANLGANAGSSTAVDGLTALVGVPGDTWSTSPPGEVLVYEGGTAGWDLLQVLLSDTPYHADQFGLAVALEGDTAAVYASHGGAPDVTFFARGDTWAQTAKVPVPSCYVGSVALSGDTAMAGPCVLVRDGTGAWSEEAHLAGTTTYGVKSAISGDIAVVAFDRSDVRVFARSGGTWTEQSSVSFASAVQSLALAGTSLLIGGNGKATAYRLGRADGDACSADGDCASGACQGSVCCAASVCGLPVGAACTPGVTPCVSGFCYDGHCCNRSCASACEVCNPGDLGISGHGNGTCVVAPARSGGKLASCGPFACDGVHVFCPGSCAADTSCPEGQYCAGGECASPKRLGEPCPECGGSYSYCSACASGLCADGVCCNEACTQPCSVCAAASGAWADGVCSVAPAGSRGRCEDYLCDGTSDQCPTSCSSRSQCPPGYDCKNHACIPGQPGDACDGDEDCVSATCRDHVCCFGACAEGCTTCAAAHGAAMDGECTTLAAGWPGACGHYLCQGEPTCPTVCGSDVHCVDGAHCSGGECHKSGCQAGTGTATGWLGALVFGLIVLGTARRRS